MRLGRRPTSRLRSVLRQHLESFTVTRVSGESTNDLGEVTETTTTITEDLWIFETATQKIEDLFGEDLTGDAAGLALDGADIQHGDKLTFQSTEYEVEDVTNVTTENGVVMERFALQKVDN